MTDEELLARLREAGVSKVEGFARKLQQNAGSPNVQDDLRSEGLAALMFAASGFSVEMGDRPDLLVGHDRCVVGAEVKHFRLKKQDEVGDARLRAAAGALVEYGDTLPLEGKTAWDQVVGVADSKAHQYRHDIPNILAIRSSSGHCVDDLVVRTAANILNERTVASLAEPLARLNGLLLMSPEYNVSAGRSVYFFELSQVRHALAPSLREALASIRAWRA